MIIDVISLLVMSGSLVVIAVIIGKKLHLVASIDVDLIPSERHSAVKILSYPYACVENFHELVALCSLSPGPLQGFSLVCNVGFEQHTEGSLR